MSGAFKHQMLKIVSQSGGFGRVVLAAYAYSDIRLDARLVLVNGHIHLQSVV